MNIQEIVEYAFNHFLERYNGGWGSNAVLENYAKEELQLTESDTEFFIKDFLYEGGDENKSISEFNQFYTWYYINYCVVESQVESQENFK